MKRQRITIHMSKLLKPDFEKDTLDTEHEMGLSLDADEEHPKPLHMLADIEKAEAYKRTH